MQELLDRYPILKECKCHIEKAIDIIETTYFSGGKVMLCGNGGSCADCDHIVGELMKGFRLKRSLADFEKAVLESMGKEGNELAQQLQKAVPAISLAAQPGINSAFCNDVNSKMAYAQLAFGYGKEEDCLICLSTSGNSENIVYAALAAKAKGIKTIALTGAKSSRLSEICDVTVKVPEAETYKVQELHLPICHYICAKVEEDLFGGEE